MDDTWPRMDTIRPRMDTIGPLLHPANCRLAGVMQVFSRAELLAQGMSPHDIGAAVAVGRLTRVGRAAYIVGEVVDEASRHLALIRACSGDTLAMESAAIIHDLPVAALPRAVQVIVPGDGTSWQRSTRTSRSAPLPLDQETVVDGHRLTTIARTVVDLARFRPGRAAVITWEAARWRANTAHRDEQLQQDIAEVMTTLQGRNGMGAARSMAQFASSASQSPMESVSRWNMRALGLPAPVQQFDVVDEYGAVVGTPDFGWPEYGVVGEYDGEGKYQELASPGQSPADVFWKEKRRQERIEDLGWIVVRWNKQEIRRPELMKTKIERAFRRAQGRRPAA